MKRQGKISDQIITKVKNSEKLKRRKELDGDMTKTISTGSTLLDLAISGGRKRGGGIPSGILVEIFGPSGSGKTVLLCEIAGGVVRQGGDVMFNDPEARLNKQFARLFDLDIHSIEYSQPNTVPEVFKPIRKWSPKEGKVNGIFTDSLAALSTDLEMDKEEGDKMGMRRAKEFSEELRKTCRILSEKNLLLVASNQLRENTSGFGPKYKSPGGEAIGFYSSLRLRTLFPKEPKIISKKTIAGKEVSRVVGVKINVEVFKSSVWEPYRTAPLIIYFNYGIDDIRANLQFIKDYTKATSYELDGQILGQSMDKAIQVVEGADLERTIRRNVIDLWEEIEEKFKVERKAKKR